MSRHAGGRPAARVISEPYGALRKHRAIIVSTRDPILPACTCSTSTVLLWIPPPDICGAIQEVLYAHGRPEVSGEFLRKLHRAALLDVFSDVGFERGTIDALIAAVSSSYIWLASIRQPRSIPASRRCCSSLGGKKSTATTKGTPTTKAILEQFGLLAYFDHVQGTDGFPAKPEPDVILPR